VVALFSCEGEGALGLRGSLALDVDSRRMRPDPRVRRLPRARQAPADRWGGRAAIV